VVSSQTWHYVQNGYNETRTITVTARWLGGRYITRARDIVY
jgi:hypothetical protein